MKPGLLLHTAAGKCSALCSMAEYRAQSSSPAAAQLQGGGGCHTGGGEVTGAGEAENDRESRDNPVRAARSALSLLITT